MNKDLVKIKYIIGSFRDDPNYPTLEDFKYLIENWWFNEGGEHFIHNYRGIPKSEGIIFPDNILKEKLNGDEKVTDNLLTSLLSDGKIQLNKKTKFTSYYEII